MAVGVRNASEIVSIGRRSSVRHTLALAALGLGASAAAQAAEPPVARFVIAVGHNEAPDRPALRYADDDAARMFEILSPGAELAVLHTAFDAESQPIFAELRAVAAPPTRAAVIATLARVTERAAAARRAGRRTELFFYHAGHGDVDDGQGHVFLADGRLDGAMLETHLLEAPERPDRVHLAVDACKSYFLVAGRGPGTTTRQPAPVAFAGPVRRPGVGYLLSTSSDADAHEWGAVGGGVFSHLLRSALLGGADADLDARVTYDEVGAFMGAATEGVTAGPFRPDVFVRPPPEDARAALGTPAAMALTPLRIEAAEAGRLLIVDERGLRFAEAHKAAGTPLMVWLAGPRRYEVRFAGRRYAVEARGAPLVLSEAGRLPEGDVVATRGEAWRALEGLYREPFSPDIVRGYRLGHDDAAAGASLPGPVPPAEDTGLTAGLLGGGALFLAGGVVLAVLAADAHADAAGATQRARADLTDRGNALTYGAGTAFVLGAAALGWGLWRGVGRP
jgi:hypothetical protein